MLVSTVFWWDCFFFVFSHSHPFCMGLSSSHSSTRGLSCILLFLYLNKVLSVSCNNHSSFYSVFFCPLFHQSHSTRPNMMLHPSERRTLLCLFFRDRVIVFSDFSFLSLLVIGRFCFYMFSSHHPALSWIARSWFLVIIKVYIIAPTNRKNN